MTKLSLTPPAAPQREVLEAGPYSARIVQVIDLGLQPGNAAFNKPPHQRVNITYEFLDEFMKDAEGNEDPAKPRWISENFNIYGRVVDNSVCAQRLKALDPTGKIEDDNIFELIDMPCVVTIVHNPKADGNGVWENIGGVAPMRAKDAAKAPELVNAPVLFSTAQPDMEVFNKLPDFLKKKIIGAVDFKGSALDVGLGGVSTTNTGNSGSNVRTADAVVDSVDDDEIPY